MKKNINYKINVFFCIYYICTFIQNKLDVNYQSNKAKENLLRMIRR